MSTMRPRKPDCPKRRPGVTLVELIVAIVIIGVAMAGLTVALTRANRASVDPIIQQQKIAIAESIMGEAVLKPWGSGVPAPTAGARENFTEVGQFKSYGLSNGLPVFGITDVDGNKIAGLEAYAVTVDVVHPTSAATALGTVPYADTLRIVVAVRHTSDPANGSGDFVLTGWRTRPTP